jgi:hypothetical protein
MSNAKSLQEFYPRPPLLEKEGEGTVHRESSMWYLVDRPQTLKTMRIGKTWKPAVSPVIAYSTAQNCAFPDHFVFQFTIVGIVSYHKLNIMPCLGFCSYKLFRYHVSYENTMFLLLYTYIHTIHTIKFSVRSHNSPADITWPLIHEQ